jgi:hypothetical protein
MAPVLAHDKRCCEGGQGLSPHRNHAVAWAPTAFRPLLTGSTASGKPIRGRSHDPYTRADQGDAEFVPRQEHGQRRHCAPRLPVLACQLIEPRNELDSGPIWTMSIALPGSTRLRPALLPHRSGRGRALSSFSKEGNQWFIHILWKPGQQSQSAQRLVSISTR